MKKLLPFFVFMLLTSVFISCSGDDDGAPASGNIIGVWKYHRMGGIMNGEEFLLPYQSECSSETDRVEFAHNNLAKTYYHEEDCSLDYAEGTWELSDNILSTLIDGYAETAEVLLLTDTTLKVKSYDMNEVIITELKRL